MDSINQITILIEDLKNSMELKIVPSTLKVYRKKQEKEISKEMIEDLLNIICKWERESIDQGMIDAQTYLVKVYTTDGKIDQYFGKGKYPNNYSEFLELVRDIYG